MHYTYYFIIYTLVKYTIHRLTDADTHDTYFVMNVFQVTTKIKIANLIKPS